MIIKTDITDGRINEEDPHVVVWDEKYNTGIQLIDFQHKKLVDLIDELYHACFTGQSAEAVFKETMSRMVDYVHFHFSAEQELLKRIGYPEYHEHKRQHDTLINDIFHAAKDYEEGKKFVPNAFVRTLKDWVLSHIAVYDKNFALYIAAQKRKGLLTDEELIT